MGVLSNDGAALSAIAAQAGIPESTAQRMAAVFMRHGLLSRIGRGRYVAGLRLAELARTGDARAVLAGAGRPLLRQLANTLGATTHLGVLEGDMVTYVVKEASGGAALLTREANQLEAYCTGIGKVLLAALDDPARARYLAGGPFIRLTSNTLTDVPALDEELQRAAANGFAVDRAEFDEGLYCLAVPVCGPDGRVLAAISASSPSDHFDHADWLRQIQACAARIGHRLGAPRHGVARQTGAGLR